MATSIIFEERLEIPMTIRSLSEFRDWALSDEFPQSGRIDFIGGNIEVDMAPQELFGHGDLKGEIYAVVRAFVKQRRLGRVFTDRTRVSSPVGDFSAEPDVVFISHEGLRADRVRLVPEARQRPGRYVEIEGAPDLIVEVVSDSSVAKDTRRLPAAYHRAGVPEFWLADARGAEAVFVVHRLGAEGYEPVERGADGFQRSAALGAGVRLDASKDEAGHWWFDLKLEQFQEDV